MNDLIHEIVAHLPMGMCLSIIADPHRSTKSSAGHGIANSYWTLMRPNLESRAVEFGQPLPSVLPSDGKVARTTGFRHCESTPFE